MKIASWLFALLLGAVLFYACAQWDSSGDSLHLLANHVSPRYVQSFPETGIASSMGAVLADYRGFDLMAISLLFLAATLVILLYFQKPPHPGQAFPLVLWLAGFGALLGLGFLCLPQGSNFLDFEALAAWTSSARARPDGALILTGGALLCLGAFLTLALRWLQTPGDLEDP
ncbi:MAG TPA: hypothetical protein VMV05_09460 [bacterium]|nr:hypothetical protein [bacterium]